MVVDAWAGCFGVGDAKCTYGTGAFLLMNTGEHCIPSTRCGRDPGREPTFTFKPSFHPSTTLPDPFFHRPAPSFVFVPSGLLTTVGYQLSTGAPATYCLEGSVAYAGLLVQWLRDNLQVASPPLRSLVPARIARAPHRSTILI